MQTIELEIKSHLKVELELKTYPRLDSDKKIIRKALEIVKKHSPRIYNYVSKEDVISNLRKFKIKVLCAGEIDRSEIKRILKIWLSKEKGKRLLYSIIELLIFPFTALLTPIPGPNVPFFSVLILFYFHFKGFWSLKGLKVEDLSLDYE